MPQHIETSYIILYLLSYVLLLICLLSSYNLQVVSLQAFSIIYLAMMPFPLIMTSTFSKEKEPLMGLVIGTAGLVIIGFIGALIGQFQIMGVLEAQYPISPALLLYLMLVIPNATAEESFFRITLINTLKPIMGTKWAILTQAVIFGVFHYYAYGMSITGIFTATIAGIFLGAVYVKYKSEFAIVGSHIIYNVICTLLR